MIYIFNSFLSRDPDNVVLCILATDDEDVKDVALQIHFTLIQAFCCENDINILRVNNTRRLAEILGGGGGGKQSGGEPMDLHCVLVTVSTYSFKSQLYESCIMMLNKVLEHVIETAIHGRTCQYLSFACGKHAHDSSLL